MITFEVPTPYLATLTEFTVDRMPEVSLEVRSLESSVEYAVLKDYRDDGHNAVTKSLKFNIVNLPEATIKGINNYFKSLKGVTPLAVEENAVITYYRITDWSINVDSQKFMSISVIGEEAFNVS